MAYETSRKRITLAGFRLAHYIVDLYKKAKEEGNLMGESFGEKWQPKERSIKEWKKLLAESSKKAFKLSHLPYIRNIMSEQ